MTAVNEDSPWKYALTPGLPYVDGHVVVTGPELDIDQVITDALSTDIQLDPTPLEVDLDFLPDVAPPGWPVIFPPDTLAIRLYRTSSPVPDTVTRLDEISRALGLSVFADPNYVTGFPPASVSADPWDIGGAPWDIGGAPSIPTGDRAPEELFHAQWALSPEHGINVANGVSRTVPYTGTGQRVAVFDTSPFGQPGGKFFQGWLEPPFKVCVSHPQPSPLPIEPASAHFSVPDHGLFVAGLAHAVAPGSNLDLIRSLNDEGQGDMFWLIANLADYASQQSSLIASTPSPGTLQDTVINLSLGVHPPPKLIGILLDRDEETGLLQWILDSTRPPLAVLGDWSTVQEPIVSLETLLAILHAYNGATVVAAAGNASGNDNVAQPVSATVPANYPFVIGVAASNIERQQACFSNEGDVSAPGGEGGAPLPGATHTTPLSNPPCYPRLPAEDCPNIPGAPGDCSYGVLSVVVTAQNGFAFWTGTSFATPLISGVAALELEAGIPYTQVLTHTLESVDASHIVAVPTAVVP
jgi:hypothetical protein